MNESKEHSIKKKPNKRSKRGKNSGQKDPQEQQQKEESVPPRRPNGVTKPSPSRKRNTKKPINNNDGNVSNNKDRQMNNKSGHGAKNGRNNRQRSCNRAGGGNGKMRYPDYVPLDECLKRYAANDKKLVRGKLRTMPGGGISFVSCDRGSYGKDVLLDGELYRNRAIDGDLVYVDVIGPVSEKNVSNGTSCSQYVVETGNEEGEKSALGGVDLNDRMEQMALNECSGLKFGTNGLDSDDVQDHDSASGLESSSDSDSVEDYETWQDDEVQYNLWNPIVNIRRRSSNFHNVANHPDIDNEEQYYGKVIHVVPPATSIQQASEINPSDERFRNLKPRRIIVGTVSRAPGGNNNRYLFIPNSRCLPRFMTPASTKLTDEESNKKLFKAEYVYGTWDATAKWPPCINLSPMGQSASVEDETKALLLEYGVDHGEFSPGVLKDVEDSVKSGRFQEDGSHELGWKPTPEMYKGRRDYRRERIFTIDPTTAKDLDDALHIKQLSDGRVEIGVHIADVSHFVTPSSLVDVEAARRTTTVYLVDRVIPMLPRPLCEIACSLNENVERLAFSCVWTMNMDGTLAKKKSKGKKSNENDVWYGRTVIKSCARLDYATAQNIIDGKVACGAGDPDPAFWPKSRQPTGGHTIEEVAADVRLMHKVAMARRKLRFENGALALNGVKLAFQMEDDGTTPALCEPYPIRDSNRLIEEYMLLANYLVAQRLITHAGGLALLRQHAPPLKNGLQSVIDIAYEKGFEIDGSTSKSLQESLSRMGRECDDKLVMQCITELLMTPMRPAEYIAAGQFEEFDWAHFALNIPYYTHFTSPIRRYPDVLVHRLLQATLDGKEAIEEFPMSEEEIQDISAHCNDKRMASKKAQERSDRVFLSIYLRSNPILSTLGVVVSIGEKAFTVYVRSIGVSGMVYIDEHSESFETKVIKYESGRRFMTLTPRNSDGPPININIFTKLAISCHCKDDPPLDVKLKVVGPWEE
jgi:Exoribonuclease R